MSNRTAITGKGEVTFKNVMRNDSLKMPSLTAMPLGVSQTGQAMPRVVVTTNAEIVHFITKDGIGGDFEFNVG